MPLFIFWIIFVLDLELNFIGKLLVLRWGLIVLLLLQFFVFLFCFERFHEVSHTGNKADIIKAFSSTLIYLQVDNLLNIDNIYLDQIVDRIYTLQNN